MSDLLCVKDQIWKSGINLILLTMVMFSVVLLDDDVDDFQLSNRGNLLHLNHFICGYKKISILI